jgi:hypothetical protein
LLALLLDEEDGAELMDVDFTTKRSAPSSKK